MQPSSHFPEPATMATAPSYVSSSLLMLLMLLTVTWRGAAGVPVSSRAVESCRRCSSNFRNLLENIKELLKSDELCFGIPSSRVVVSSDSDTLLTCTPTVTQNTSCLVQRNSSFSETECMRNIRKDLDHYAAAFRSYMEAPLRDPRREVALLSPTVDMIQSLRKSCFLPKKEDDSMKEDVAQMWGSDTFSNRQRMCKMMRGFYTRSITINRAVGYISSGEHRK